MSTSVADSAEQADVASKREPDGSAPPAPSAMSFEGDGRASSPAAAEKSTADRDAAGGNEKLTVSRFLIQNIKGRRGYAQTDYRIDLIKERHGLYDLVSTVYDILRRDGLTGDSINSHLWDVKFSGTVYKNGWRRGNPLDGTFDRPARANEVDHGERRLFSTLATGALQKGQRGMCGGESARFDIVVEDPSLKTLDESAVNVKITDPFEIFKRDFEEKKKEENSSLPRYPKATKAAISISGSLEDQWIESDQRSRCADLRRAWSSYYSGENSWKRDRRTRDWVPTKPQSPPWNGDEIAIIGLLLNSDCKFKRSWNSILQYAFVDRSESAASMKWYQLKGKDNYMIEREGRGMTNEGRIRLAKRLAGRVLAGRVEGGSPTADPHPNARMEARLRKRGIIDDDTDSYERKRLCAWHREMLSDSDSDC